jgi:multiple sugar transport system substrate-binding protein
LNAITVEGNLLGLPFKAHPGFAVTYYNQSAIEAEGLPVPQAGWTQEEHLELAKALTKSEGDRTTQFGFLPGVNAWWKTFVTLNRAFGGEMLSEDGTTFQIMEDAGRQAMQYIYDVFHTHKVAPLPDQIIGTQDEMWIAGQLATVGSGTYFAVHDAAIGDSFEWMVAPNPVGPSGTGGSDYEADAQCVTTTTEHPTEAFKWVQYLCSRESGVQLGLIGGTVGGRPDVYGAEELLAFPFRVVFKEVMDNAQASRITANWRQSEAEAAFTQLMQPIWAGTEQPTDAYLETMRSQIQDILDKPKP